MFEHPEFNGHESVAMHYDAASGLKAIIVIHNTVRGPALGGCRMISYANTEEALTDALRLSRGMTYKSAIADLPLGGGKMVIIGDPKTMKTPELLHAAGHFIDSFRGTYISGEDMGMTSADCKIIAEVTPHVGGVFQTAHAGDPSPITAFGVECAMRAAWRVHSGATSLKGVVCGIEGLGNVGLVLARRLYQHGAIIYASDVDNEKLLRAVKEMPLIAIMDTMELRRSNANIYVPCARGGVVNDETVPEFKTPVIVGSANNILDRPIHADMLAERGILCVPDYVANCGGLIDIHYQRIGYDEKKVNDHVYKVAFQTTLRILRRAKKEKLSPQFIADTIAESRFAP
jgi:leucine dehydrogenase